MDQVISALVTPGGAGMSGLPAIVGGTALSTAVWIAKRGITTGVTISELRVTAASGGTSSRTGRRSTKAGARDFRYQTAPPTTATMATTRVTARLRRALFIPCRSPD
jgi:hypothetical protein